MNNGLLRDYFPKGTDLTHTPEHRLRGHRPDSSLRDGPTGSAGDLGTGPAGADR
jgi:hypothetical protein